MLLSYYLSLIFQINGRIRRWEAGRIWSVREAGVLETGEERSGGGVLKRREAGEMVGNYATVLIILQSKKA